MNNELAKLPGFFFCPTDTTDLVELTVQERMEIMGSGQGNYMVHVVDMSSDFHRADLLCALDNNRIPTHRRTDITMPGFGAVPINL